MISIDTKIKLAIASTKMIGRMVPLDALAEHLRDSFGVELSDRQIAAIFSQWRKMKFKIEKKRHTHTEGGCNRVRSLYRTDAKTIKRLLDLLYRRQYIFDKSSLR